MLFVDVRGFTSLTEKVSPSELTVLMNRFYSVASEEVVRLDGTVDRFVGDQIMAFFGAPYRREDHVERAVEAAVAITKAVNDMSNELAVGAGVSTGVAFVGNVGAADVNDFTVLGDVVNVASRLQGHASPGEVLLAERTFERLGETYQFVDERQLELKGKAGTTRVWVLRP